MTAWLMPVAPARPACTDADPEEFFRGNRESNGDAMARARRLAVDYCAVCPIFDWCAAQAQQFNAEGLWAGVWRQRGNGGGDSYTIRVHDLLTSPPPTPRAPRKPAPRTPQPPPVTYCRACGRGPLANPNDHTVPPKMRHRSRGLDSSCYCLLRAKGQLAQYPQLRPNHGALLDAYGQLVASGVTDRQRIADALGVSPKTVRNWEWGQGRAA